MRLTAAASRAIIVIRFAVCDKVLAPKHKEGRGQGWGTCVSVSQVIHTVYKTPAAIVQGRNMFIDVSGCPREHNMAERNKQKLSEQRTDEQTSKRIRDRWVYTSQRCFHIHQLVFDGNIHFFFIVFVIYLLFYIGIYKIFTSNNGFISCSTNGLNTTQHKDGFNPVKQPTGGG